MLATALATPKLFIHVFIGSRLAKIAGDVDGMDAGAKLVNWLGVVVSMAAGAFTAWFIYRQTKRRAEELEVQERGLSHQDEGDNEEGEDDVDYDEDFSEETAAPVVGGGQQQQQQLRKGNGEGYRDESSSEEGR